MCEERIIDRECASRSRRQETVGEREAWEVKLSDGDEQDLETGSRERI